MTVIGESIMRGGHRGRDRFDMGGPVSAAAKELRNRIPDRDENVDIGLGPGPCRATQPWTRLSKTGA